MQSIARALTLSLAALGLGALMHNANAQGIGINFTGGGHLLAPTDQPGLVAGANWNNVVGGGGTTLSNLLNSAGTATTASITVNGGANFDGFSGTSTSNPATSQMYQGGLFGLGVGSNNPNSQASVTVSNIPFATYDVYVYASADTGVTNTLSDTIGGTTYYYASNGTGNNTATSLLQTTSTNPNSPTVGPGQYQLFSGLSGSSFTLTTDGSLTNVLGNNIFGLQIVVPAGAPVPEPGSVALLIGAGIGGLMLKRRRK